MTAWTFHSAGSIVFGRGALSQLPTILARQSSRRVFLIADDVLTSVGIVNTVTALLTDFTVETFTAITPEPPEETVFAAIAAAKQFQPDVIIGLGGGSNMDAAKLVAICHMHGGKPSDFAGDCRVPGPITPLICIPTTAGTGSEVSAAAVFTDAANKMKISCLSPYIRPMVAIVDPSLTDNCPAKVTADSGIDALTHAIEAYTAVGHSEFVTRPPGGETVYQGKNPIADAMAERCIRLVGEHLKNVVLEPHNLAARDGMALAATLGGLAFANAGVALVHAMEYPVGGAVHVSHGAGNGLLLPYVMKFNAEVRGDAMSDIGKFLGVRRDAETAIEFIEQLRKDIGIPTRLRDLGVTTDQLPGFADKAFAIKRLMRVSPRMPSRDDILAIYQAAF
ncbi:iron-containing alcohol dehydrogenase [soil metagenome]